MNSGLRGNEQLVTITYLPLPPLHMRRTSVILSLQLRHPQVCELIDSGVGQGRPNREDWEMQLLNRNETIIELDFELLYVYDVM